MNALMTQIEEAGGRIRADERVRANILQLEQNINAFKRANGILRVGVYSLVALRVIFSKFKKNSAIFRAWRKIS
jgi:hypothetical protein